MSRPAHSATKPATALPVAITLAAVLLAGCLDGTDDADRADTDARGASTGHGVTLLMSGLDAPEAGDDHAVMFQIGHIGLFDANSNEWRPLLTEPVTVTVFFLDANRTTVDTFAILEGTYTEVELLIDAATVVAPAGTEPATVDEPVCYAPIHLDLTSDLPATELELFVSGAEGVHGSPGDWRVRPALVGSTTDDSDAAPRLADVECAPG